MIGSGRGSESGICSDSDRETRRTKTTITTFTISTATKNGNKYPSTTLKKSGGILSTRTKERSCSAASNGDGSSGCGSENENNNEKKKMSAPTTPTMTSYRTKATQSTLKSTACSLYHSETSSAMGS